MMEPDVFTTLRWFGSGSPIVPVVQPSQLAAKGATIAIKHYGTRDAMQAAGKKQEEVSEVIASHLAREVIPK